MFARMFRRSTVHRARRRSVRFRPGLAGLETRTMLSSIPTTTALSASTATAAYGQLVDFKATVSADAPSHATPVGAVQFEIDGAACGKPVALSDGKASISDAALPVVRRRSRPATSRPTARSPPAARPDSRRPSPPTRPPPWCRPRSIRPASVSR